jgi:hypothetical protein
MKKTLTMAMLAVCVAGASGQTLSQTGKITGYIPYESGGKQIFLFQVQGVAAAGCNSTGRFALDSNALKFKATQAAVMAAFHSQSDVTVLYTQTCAAWSNSYDMSAVCVGTLAC